MLQRALDREQEEYDHSHTTFQEEEEEYVYGNDHDAIPEASNEDQSEKSYDLDDVLRPTRAKASPEKTEKAKVQIQQQQQHPMERSNNSSNGSVNQRPILRASSFNYKQEPDDDPDFSYSSLSFENSQELKTPRPFHLKRESGSLSPVKSKSDNRLRASSSGELQSNATKSQSMPALEALTAAPPLSDEVKKTTAQPKEMKQSPAQTLVNEPERRPMNASVDWMRKPKGSPQASVKKVSIIDRETESPHDRYGSSEGGEHYPKKTAAVRSSPSKDHAQELIQLERVCSELQKQLQQAQQQIARMEKQESEKRLQPSDGDRMILMQEFQEKEARLLEAAAEDHEQELRMLRNDMDTKFTALQSEVERERSLFEQERRRMQKRVEEATQRAERAERHAEKERSIQEQSVAQQHHQQERELRRNADKLANTMALLDERDGQIAKLKAKIKELQSSMNAHQKGAREAESEMDELHHENEDLRAHLEQVEAHCNELQARADELQADSDNLSNLKVRKDSSVMVLSLHALTHLFRGIILVRWSSIWSKRTWNASGRNTGLPLNRLRKTPPSSWMNEMLPLQKYKT
jgi:hypothetical protein